MESSELELNDGHPTTNLDWMAKPETEVKSINKDSENNINKQIRNLIRKRVELRKMGKNPRFVLMRMLRLWMTNIFHPFPSVSLEIGLESYQTLGLPRPWPLWTVAGLRRV